MDAVRVSVAEGAPMLMDGPVLSTVKVVLAEDAGALLPAVSVAVFAPMLMPSVPFPAMLEIETVRVFPVPVTTRVPVAVSVAFNVMFPVARVEAEKFVSV